MLDLFKRKQQAHAGEQNKKKRDVAFIFTLILLITFLIISLVTGMTGGTFREMKFQFHFSDGAALVALAVAYLIYKIKRGQNNDR